MNRLHYYSIKFPLSTLLPLFFLLLGIVGFGQTDHSKQIDEVRVGIAPNKPMCYFDGNGKPAGIFVAVIEYAAAKEGWKLVYVKDNFSSLLKKLEKGKIDIILSMAVSEERKKLYSYNKTDVFNNWAEVYILPKEKIHSLLDLKDKRVATLEKGIYSTGPEGIISLGKKFHLNCEFILVDDYKTGLEAVKEGNADAAVVNRLVGAIYEKEFGLQKSGIVFAPVEIRFGLNKESSKTPPLIKALDRHLTNLIQDNNSIYHRTISAALGGSQNIMVVPNWIWFSLAVSAGLTLVLFVFAFLLRWQVKKKTKALDDANIKLSNSEKQYRRLVESTMIVPWELDLKTRKFTYMGPQAGELFGYPVESWVDFNTWTERLHPDDKKHSAEYYSAVTDQSKDYDFTYRIIHANGSILWIHDVVSVVVGSDGPEALVGFMHDITDRIRAENELMREKEFIEISLDSQIDTFFVFNVRTGMALRWNKSFSAISGYSNEEISTQKVPECYYSMEDIKKAKEYIEKVLSGGSGTVELDLIIKDGSRIPTEYSASLINNKDGEPNYIIAVGRDIRERKKSETEKANLEAKLRQAHKMEAIGNLAGGIAHDFNNILTAIMGYTELAIHDIDGPENLKGNLTEVLKGANRAKELVKQILTFSHRGDQQFHPIRVQAVAEEVLKLLRSSIPTTIEIKQNIDQGCETVLADPTQIHQVIMNLCTNAYHAMRKTGGILAVSLRTIHFTKEDLVSKIHLEPGAYLKLEISDTGVGMTKDVQDRIFEPYFSIKEKGEGTGLGLAVVHGIISSLQGDISVYSEPGKGTTFIVYLPAFETEDDIVQEEELTTQLPTGKEHILLVDDDKAIVNLNKALLEKLGYQVTGLTSSEDTLNTFEKAPDDFDLVITDMTMPKMTGAELAQRILTIRPSIPIILCTGYSELINEERAKAIGIRDYVLKPFIKKDFANTIRKVLDAS